MGKETEVKWIRRGIGWTDDMSILKYTLVAVVVFFPVLIILRRPALNA